MVNVAAHETDYNKIKGELQKHSFTTYTKNPGTVTIYNIFTEPYKQ